MAPQVLPELAASLASTVKTASPERRGRTARQAFLALQGPQDIMASPDSMVHRVLSANLAIQARKALQGILAASVRPGGNSGLLVLDYPNPCAKYVRLGHLGCGCRQAGQ